MKYQPRVQQTPQEALMAALPAPPASHQRKKSRCSLKSRQLQNQNRCDLAKEGTRRGSGEGTQAAVSGGGSPAPPERGRGAGGGRHSTRLLRQLQGLPSQLLCSWDKPLPRHRHTGQTSRVRPARGQDRPAAKRWLVPVQPC